MKHIKYIKLTAFIIYGYYCSIYTCDAAQKGGDVLLQSPAERTHHATKDEANATMLPELAPINPKLNSSGKTYNPQPSKSLKEFISDEIRILENDRALVTQKMNGGAKNEVGKKLLIDPYDKAISELRSLEQHPTENAKPIDIQQSVQRILNKYFPQDDY